MVIIDAQQLLYHVIWPVGGNVSVLVASMKQIFEKYADSKDVLVFDKYEDCSRRTRKETVMVVVQGPLTTTSLTRQTFLAEKQ